MHDTQQLLVDVRKSYRLLHDYQRLVMDAVAFIGNQLEFSYHSGHPKFSGKAKNNIETTMAWAWLNMYYHEFHFQKEVNGELLRMSAVHIADTAALEVGDQDKTDTSKFPSVHESNSKIGFCISKEADLTSWDHWNVEFLNKKDQRVDFAQNGNLPEKSLNLGMQAMSFDIQKIFTAESAIDVANQLKSNFTYL